jgi:hypothetical protein
MELMAAIQGLLGFKGPCEVEITTGSEFIGEESRKGDPMEALPLVEEESPSAQRRSLVRTGRVG